MSYIQVTTRCNMSCGHCCYGCDAQGEDMTMEVFQAAVALDPVVAIGGGEPTLHPLFWEMVRHCLANPEMEMLWLATNGSRTEDALVLAKLARHGVLGVALSQDEWHDPIDPRVVKAFTKGRKADTYGQTDRDSREIRSVSEERLVNAGRCDFGDGGCCCSELFVEPSGRIRFCGCPDAPVIGHVLEGGVDPAYEEVAREGSCHKTALSGYGEEKRRETA